MLVPVHATIGGLIGEKLFATQWLAFVFGFLSHFILDIIPHNDAVNLDQAQEKSRRPELHLLVAGQIAVTFLILVIWLIWFDLAHAQALILGMFGAVLPDGLWGIYERFKIKQLKWFFNLHNYVHEFFSFKISRKKALAAQGFLIILVSWLL